MRRHKRKKESHKTKLFTLSKLEPAVRLKVRPLDFAFSALGADLRCISFGLVQSTVPIPVAATKVQLHTRDARARKASRDRRKVACVAAARIPHSARTIGPVAPAHS